MKQRGEWAWQRAASFAARAHRHGLRRDGQTPYVAHPFRVAMTVRHVFGCDDAAAVTIALLHDTIEDTGTDYDDLEAEFGGEVARAVAALTKNAALPEGDREAEYDARLAKADWRARLVKLADCYDNFLDAGDAAKKGKMMRKARRALKLAAGDREPCVVRAAAALRSLIRGKDGRSKRRP